MIEELVARVFQARDFAHKAHWRTNSYAQHMALGSFYDDIVQAIDAVVEAHQGQFGLIDADDVSDVKTPKVFSPGSVYANYLRSEAEWIEANRELISSGSSAIGNLVDSLTAIYLAAAYKLESLS